MDNNYKSMCRVCLLKDSSSFMRPLADQKTRQMLFECTSVRVSCGDNYPQQMCSKCWIQCKSWAAFKALAKDSDRQLRFVDNDEGQPMDKGVVQEENCPETNEECESFEHVEIKTVNVKEELAPDEKEREEEGDPIGSAPERPPQHHKCKYCFKSFSTFTNLRDHQRVHADETSFPCDVCGQKFRSTAILNQHKLIHQGIKPIQFDQCGQQFSQGHSLIRHKMVHSDKKELKCGNCEYRCKRKSDLTRHMKSNHKGSYRPLSQE